MQIYSSLILFTAAGIGSGLLASQGADALSVKIASLFDKTFHSKVEVLAKRFVYSLLAADAAWECMLVAKVASLLLQKNLLTVLFLTPLLNQLIIHSFMAAFCLTVLIRGLIIETRQANPKRVWQNSLIGIWLALHVGVFLGALGYLAGATVISKERQSSKQESYNDNSCSKVSKPLN